MLSAADIKAVFELAHLNAVHEYLDGLEQKRHSSLSSHSSHLSKNPPRISIKGRHILRAFTSTRPSLSLDDRKELAKGYMPFVNMNSQNEAFAMRGFGMASTALIKQSLVQIEQPQKMTFKINNASFLDIKTNKPIVKKNSL